jgi:tetratricopeptide (TPR) repeat protein
VYVASPKHRPQPATTPTTTASPSIEPTAAAPPEVLLAEYDAAIADGDLAHASEIAERLAVTAEKDPRVAVRRARVAVVKADRVWLASRLASPSSAPSAGDDLVSMLVARELTTLGEQASTLSAAALAAAPDDTQAVLARIDALRIAGKLEDADALVPRVEAKRDDGDVAYTLGALDFVERKSQVAGAPAGLADMQRAAAAAPKLGRPQALLAFLLADSGDLDAAREAARGLDSLGRPHPLVAPLRRFIASRSTKPAADSAQSAQQPSSAIEVPDTPKPVTPSTAPELVARGDAARAKGDRGAAQTFYARALALNPNSLPALLGRADVEWDTGMRARAAAHYKQIAERFPQAPPRVKDRLATE